MSGSTAISDDIETVGEIEIEQDRKHLEREWRFQRVGWVLLLLIVLAALSGLLGRGPLARARSGPANAPVRLEYERIVRHGSPTVLTVLLSPEANREKTVRLWIERGYLEAVEIERIVPEPEQQEVTEQGGIPGILYSIRLMRSGQPARVCLYIKPDHYGLQRGKIGLSERPAVSFEQWVLP
jgi:hypothetical protein